MCGGNRALCLDNTYGVGLALSHSVVWYQFLHRKRPGGAYALILEMLVLWLQLLGVDNLAELVSTYNIGNQNHPFISKYQTLTVLSNGLKFDQEFDI